MTRAYDGESGTLRVRLGYADKEIARLRAEVETKENAAAVLAGQVAQFRSEAEGLRAEVATAVRVATENVGRLTVRALAAERERDEARALVDGLQQEAARLRAARDAAEARAKEAEGVLAELCVYLQPSEEDIGTAEWCMETDNGLMLARALLASREGVGK